MTGRPGSVKNRAWRRGPARERTLVKKIAVITHRRSEATNAAFLEVLEICRRLGIEVVVPEREAAKTALPDDSRLARIVPSLRSEPVDFCVALGGDGTILRAFSRFSDMSTPVLGINFGRMGFLSAIGPMEIQTKLVAVLEGDYVLLDLSLLELEHDGKRQLAINDVVVHKPDAGSVVRLGYSINGIDMDTYLCDGLVAATPAGSTAYNLSTGGPLASLELDGFLLTAIAPHTLRMRPLALSGDEELRVTNHSVGLGAAILIDGQQEGTLAPEGSVTITMSERKARLVQATGADFFRTLRDKFINPVNRD